MDIALHLRVLSRYRRLLAAGLVAAVLLALLAFVRVGPDGISYRQDERWQSVARLFATSSGNPFSESPSSSEGGIDPTTVAVLAAEFANSDAVMSRLAKNGSVGGQVLASANQVDGEFVPFIDVAGIASTPAVAKSLASRATIAMQKFVDERQASSGVRPSKRISLEIVNTPEAPTLLEGRSKTLPVMAFIGVMAAVLGLVYVRENLRVNDRRSAGAIDGQPGIQSVETREPAARAVRPDTDADPVPDRLQSRGAPKPGSTLGTSAPQSAQRGS